MSAEVESLPALDTRVVASPEEAALEVAEEMATLLREGAQRGGQVVLGLATGRTMTHVYGELTRLHAAGAFSTAAFTGVLLDEYLGLPTGDKRRFLEWIRAGLAPMNLPRERLCGPAVDGTPFGVETGARRYADWIEAQGGIDLLLLGIGSNGHIGFNEPGSRRASRARKVDLAPETREDAVRAFGSLGAAPREAVTLGIADLCAARRVRVLAFGTKKRDILRRLRTETPSERLPVSLLRGHPDVRLYVDHAACGGVPALR